MQTAYHGGHDLPAVAENLNAKSLGNWSMVLIPRVPVLSKYWALQNSLAAIEAIAV